LTETADLLVVGGGPAGAAAAIRGVAAGLSVVVCDKAVFPRDKTCGDGLTAAALRLLERLGLEPARVAGWTAVHDVVMRSPSGRLVELPLPDDGLFAAVAPRAALDAALLDLAGERGARIRPGTAIEGLERRRDTLRATFSAGPAVEAHYVVGADGVYSTVRKLTAPAARSYLGEWHAFRQYFSGVADRRLWVLFEPDLLPGYAWVFPLSGGRANVGFGIPRRPGASVRPMAALWRGLLRRPSLRAILGDAQPEAPHRAWPIPADLSRAPLACGRVLFAGDAAGATDPMTGEGIGQALVSGILAAEAVAGDVTGNGAADPAATGRRYAAAVEHHLGRDLRFAGMLGRVLGSPAGARGAVRAAGLTLWTRRNFARWLFEDYPRALLLTPGRWHRGALSTPSAYRSTSAPF
jgi:geranylgeranyl reductase family protein